MSQIQQQVPKIHKYTQPHSKKPGYVETSPPIWYNPRDKIFAMGEFSETEPDWNNWVWNIGEQARVQKAVKQAGVDSDPLGTAMAGLNPQWQSSFQEYIDVVEHAKREGKRNLNEAVKSAAILKREDFMAYKTILPQTKIIAAKPRRHVLLDMLNIDNQADFITKIYTFDGPYDVVQENLTELNAPDITGYPSFTPQLINMQRYGIHYAFSEEFVAEQFDFNIKQFVLDLVAVQMDIVFNKKVADVLNADTYTAYASWYAKTGNVSTRDPVADVNAEGTKIFQTERNENTVLASNRDAYNAFISNTWNSAFGTPTYKEYTYSLGNVIVSNPTNRFPGLDWGIDSFMATGKFAVFDPSAIWAARMPQRIVDYKNTYETVRGTIIRQNFVVQPIDSSRLLGGSGVTP